MYVYILSESDNGPCKIGHGQPVRRLKHCQVGNPRKITLIHQVACKQPGKVERDAHTALGRYRLEGEWFAVSVDVAKQAVSDALAHINGVNWDDEHQKDAIWHAAALHPRAQAQPAKVILKPPSRPRILKVVRGKYTFPPSPSR